jgi:phosphoribosylformylglycinamidine cyclo-ligase
MPSGVHGVINPNSWQRPPLFRWLQQAGEVPEADLWNTFNLGVGYCLVVPASTAQQTLSICRDTGYEAWELGEVANGNAGDQPLTGLPYGG